MLNNCKPYSMYLNNWLLLYLSVKGVLDVSPKAQQPLVGQGLLIIEDSQLHSLDTPHSVRLLWTSDWPEDLYLTIRNTHKRQTFMPPVRFEPAIPASERPQPHALERCVTLLYFMELLL